MKSNKTPLVSICIPTYNGEAFIEDCLNSAINQTYSNLEIIISDDTSDDKTLYIVEAFIEKIDITISVYCHIPSGIGANWNNCVKHAKGDYIKFLFQDDVLQPNCIDKLMDLMIKDAEVAMVYSKRNFIYANETESILEFKKVYEILHTNWVDIKVEEGILDGKEYLKDGNFLNSPKNKIGEPTSVLLRKSCFDKVGYFNENLKQALDCEFWYRLMPYYKIGFVDEVLSSFRLHDAQASAVNKSKKVNESQDLYQIYYNTLMPYLSDSNKWKLKKRFHSLFSVLAKFKSKFG